MNKWLEVWKDEEHINKKINNAELIKSFLKSSPKTILEIGCGLAVESEILQKFYNSELYLLDGDFDQNIGTRDVSYGDASTMIFYNKIDTLIESFNSRNMKYNFVDAFNINLPEDIKFDLIYSFESCGFHYPAKTYKDLILKHSHKDTIVIFDIRKKSLNEQKNDFEIIEILNDTRKFITAQIKF